MRRIIAIVASLLVFATTAPVLAHTSASITPASQSRAYGALASWTVAWNSSPPGGTDILFCYGDGQCTSASSAGLSRGFSHRFYPCNSKNFQQRAEVHQSNPTHTLVVYSATYVTGGGIC